MARCDYTLRPNRNCPPDSETPYSNTCGSVPSTIVVPELEIYSRRFILDSRVNEFGVPFPAEIPTTCLPEIGSFIEMLFNECYDYDYYKYLYSEVEDKLSWPAIVRRRLNVYPISAKYMTINDSGTNLFALQSDDFTLLDALLAYRVDETAVVVIDATAAVVTTLDYDSTSNITTLTTSLASLSTELSKLIFVYLDLVVNKNTSNYSTATPISTDNSLETVYELFVIDKYFEYISCQAIDVRLGARDPDYAGQPYDPSAGPPNSNPPGGESPDDCDENIPAPNPSILQYGG